MFEGVDLLAIEGMKYTTVLSVMNEVGMDGIKKFPSTKHFASWLRIAPNNKVSGGKIHQVNYQKIAIDLK
jgi:transposase